MFGRLWREPDVGLLTGWHPGWLFTSRGDSTSRWYNQWFPTWEQMAFPQGSKDPQAAASYLLRCCLLSDWMNIDSLWCACLYIPWLHIIAGNHQQKRGRVFPVAKSLDRNGSRCESKHTNASHSWPLCLDHHSERWVSKRWTAASVGNRASVPRWEPPVMTFSSTDWCTTWVYVCFCEDTYLMDILIINSELGQQH